MDVSLLRTGEFFSVLCALLWATATILFRKSGERIPPVALNLFKNVLALLLFFPSLWALGVPFLHPDRTLDEWLLLLASGAVGIGIADSLYLSSLNRLGAGGMALVNATYTPMVLAVAAVYPGEPIGWALLGAMALMVGAILVGTWQPAALRTPGRDGTGRGVALGILSMLLMAVSILAVKPLLDRSDPWWFATVRIAGGTLFLAAQTLLPKHRRDAAAAFRPSRAWTVMVPGAIVGTYFAMVAWIAGTKYTYATIASVLNQTGVLFTVILAALFLREKITFRRAAAVALALAGAALAVL